MPALMQKEPAFLTMAGPEIGAGSIVVQTIIVSGPLSRGQITRPIRFPAPMPRAGGASLTNDQADAIAAYIGALAEDR